jgi:D-alanyl-D-alanine carboxypeptidase
MKLFGLRLMITGLLGLSFITPTIGLAEETFYTQETQTENEPFEVAAAAAISVDADTGKIFYNQNAEQPLGIASVTKLISLYLVEKAVANGDLSWDESVDISDYAAALSMDPELSNVPLEQGQSYTVQELVESLLIESANASTVALAEKVAGSEPKFVDMMRQQLKDWGINDAYIVTSSGLNNSDIGDHRYPGTPADDENKLSAKDVATVAWHLLKDYPDVLKISSIQSKVFGENTDMPFNMVNWNQLLPGNALGKEGVDGLKTGTTDFAGACFVGTMQQDGHRIITVVLNATNQPYDENARFVETSKLMDYTFDTWKYETLLDKEQAIPDVKDAAVPNGKEQQVAVMTQAPLQAWVKNAETDIPLKTKVHDVQAPAKKGTVVGTVTADISDDLGYLLKDQTAPQVNVVTTQAVEQANVFVRAWRSVTNLFN